MKLLIADDDAMTRRTLEHMSKEWGFEPVVVCDGNEAWEVLSGEDPPPLAVLDWMMPGLDGIEVCRKLRAFDRGAYVHVIMLTGRHETKDLVQAINAGADDFIAKPFDKQELRVRLRAGQRIVKLEESLRYQAMHDPLTGVFNRAVLFEMLERELARAARAETATTVLMVDLDHFKRVNDSFGHHVGDVVLREVTRRIGNLLRAFDTLGRYGGEEFLILLPSCDAEEARTVAQRLCNAVGATPIESSSGGIAVTISIGAAVSAAGEKSADCLIQEADAALYHAKQAGRNRVELSTGEEPAPKALLARRPPIA